MERNKRVVLGISLVCFALITALMRFVKGMNVLWLRIAAAAGINLLNAGVALLAMKLTGMRVRVDFRNKRQYLIGVAIALCLSMVIAVIPALCGFSLVGDHRDFSWFTLIYSFLNYMLIIGPVEELIFRVYLQDTLSDFLGKRMGVVLAAFLFGLWHLINGFFMQMVFTFGIGLVFGFARSKVRDCSYLSVALGHGLYDFLNVIVTMFIL